MTSRSKEKSNKLSKIEQNGYVPDARPKRAPIFEYPALPKLELLAYALAVFGAILYSWYKIYQASNAYEWSESGWGWYKESWLPFFGKRKKDMTNDEWTTMVPLMAKLLPIMILHSIVFNLANKILGPTNQHICDGITFGYSIIACCYVFTVQTVLFCMVQGVFIFTVTRVAKRQLAVWGAAIAMLYLTLNRTLENTVGYTNVEQFQAFFDFSLMSYKILGYISYNLEFLRGKTRQSDADFIRGLYRMFYYTFYLPYLISLIVLYPNFEKQIEERKSKPRNWLENVQFAIRIAFWYCFLEFILHFAYFDAILGDVTELYSLRKDTLTAIGMATGTFFHLKYVVIFGFPSIFARIDNMQPLEGPICMARVALYSKVWREFDRGLYVFFKEYIFLPICQPTFSIPRKIFGVLVSYSFVCVWHGITHQYIVWIVLNIIELFQEQFAKVLYTIPAVKLFRERHISDRMFRRILAWLQVVPFAFALYSNFYFLAGSEAGYVFVDRIFWQENVPMKWPACLLICLGYCYTHCCMEVDRVLSLKENRHKNLERMKKE